MMAPLGCFSIGTRGLEAMAIDWRAQREKPPGPKPAAILPIGSGLGVDRVAPFAICTLSGVYGEPHLLAESAADESAQGMRKPACHQQQLRSGCPVLSLQEGQDRCG